MGIADTDTIKVGMLADVEGKGLALEIIGITVCPTPSADPSGETNGVGVEVVEFAQFFVVDLQCADGTSAGWAYPSQIISVMTPPKAEDMGTTDGLGMVS